MHVVTSRIDESPEYELQDDGVEVHRLPCHPLMNGRLPISKINASYKHMMDELATSGIDRVLVNTRFYRHSLEGLRFAERCGILAVVLDHGSAHLTLGNRFFDWFVERYEHAITKRVKRFNPVFAGISSASVRWLEHFDIYTDKVIPNAIDADEFRACASSRDFKKGLGISDGKTLVAFVGRIEPEKGAFELAQAAKLLGENYVVAFAGSGAQKDSIEELAADNVVLLGRLDQADLSALLRDADIFCLPSRSEGFCASLLEAAVWGTLPVITHVGVADEVIGKAPDQFGAYLENTEPQSIADAIRAVQSLQVAELSSSVERIMQLFSWTASADALDKAYSSELRASIGAARSH